MERVLYFFIHYGLPAIFIAMARLRRPRSRLGLGAFAALAVAVSLFVFFWGQWPLVGSYYARLWPLAAVAVVLGYAVRDAGVLPLWHRHRLVNAGSVLLWLLAAWTGYGVANAVAGQAYPARAADLEFPLRDGRFYVSSGGSSRVINNHMRGYPNSMEYALDINEIGPGGAASTNVLSRANENHHIFGRPVHAPCAGTVVATVSDAPDNAGASMSVRRGDGAANYVEIQCDGVVVSLVHLKSGSVLVAPGQSVRAGQPLGRVGNSGFSEEPHLHLQAAARDADGNLHGVPMRFGGRSFARNDIVTAP